jgi:hypothetical protein
MRAGALPLGAVRAELRRSARDKARRRAAAATAAAGAAACNSTPGAPHAPAANSDAAAVTDDELTAAARCDECALRGTASADTPQHFIAHCDPQRYSALIDIICAALHRIGHAVSPNTRTPQCNTPSNGARSAHITPISPCDGHVMERNFRDAALTAQISTCLNGNGSWLLRNTKCGKSRHALRRITQTLVRCTQNFLMLRWRERCAKIGAAPVIAFAHANFGRQVMVPHPPRDGGAHARAGYSLSLPLPLAYTASSSAPAASAA